MKITASNKKAYFDYHIESTYEAGIVLLGHEVKSVREGRMNIKESYVRFDGAEAFLYGCHISPYSHGDNRAYEPVRKRKLLLNRQELKKLFGLITLRGYTLVPTKAYFNSRGILKLEVGVAKGKKTVDKREDKKKRILDREAHAALKNRD